MDHLTLSQLQKRIENALTSSLEPSYWVVAEISELKVNNNGHCYLELVEKSGNSHLPKAKARAAIWANKYDILNPIFEQQTGSSLKSGMMVLVNVRITFHAAYGLSYIIENIDPTYTLGDIERQRQKTIEQLQNDGIFDMNKQAETDSIFKKIAVISSSNAAGYTDFMKEIEGNMFGYKYDIHLYNTVMQGDAVTSSVLKSLDDIHSYNENNTNYDIVVIIRGGGSTSDLACFDSYDIANYVAQFPIPILSGIGHEKDISVVDMVAHKSLKTPTAVAQHIVETTRSYELQLNEYLSQVYNHGNMFISYNKELLYKRGNDINNASANAISQTKNKIDSLLNSLTRSAYNVISNQHQRLIYNDAQLTNVAKLSIISQYNKIKLLESNIEQFNPSRILSMGYSIVKINNQSVNSIEEIKENDSITIQCVDGKLNGTLTNIKSIK